MYEESILASIRIHIKKTPVFRPGFLLNQLTTLKIVRNSYANISWSKRCDRDSLACRE